MENIVSVIIPVYNVENYLVQCIDSVQAQTFRSIEIICIDDGSTDKSLFILQEYVKKDSRIKILQQQNAGAGAARNTGLSVASGKYLSFLDADDFFEPDMLEKAVASLEKSEADFVVFHSDQYQEDTSQFVYKPYVVCDSAIPPYRPINFRNLTDNVFKVFVGWAWDKLYRTDFVRRYSLSFQEQRTTNDMRFVFSALVLANRIEVIPDLLAHHRTNNKSSLSNTRERSWRCFYDALISLRENLCKYELFGELEQDFVNYALHFSLWNYETITGEKKEHLFNMLRTDWLKYLGVMDKTDSYFYNQIELNKLRYYLSLS